MLSPLQALEDLKVSARFFIHSLGEGEAFGFISFGGDAEIVARMLSPLQVYNLKWGGREAFGFISFGGDAQALHDLKISAIAPNIFYGYKNRRSHHITL